jgi:hypothetical protein
VFPGRNPARKLVGGEGKVVGEDEEVEANHLVCSVGAGVAGGGLLTVSRSSDEVWAVGGGGPAREGGMRKLGSTSRSRATHLEPRFGQRRSGKWGTTTRLSGGTNGTVVVVLGRV